MDKDFDVVLNKILDDAMTDAIKDAYDMGILKRNEMSFVPELCMYADDVCSSIYRDGYKALNEDGSMPSLEVFNETIGRFCICAGMGAVALWNTDYASLKKKGIYESLIEPRGIFEMDEYVYDLVGMDFNSKECKDFRSNSCALTQLTLSRTFKKIEPRISNDKNLLQSVMPFIFTNVFKILYKVGIAIQLQNIFESSTEPKTNDCGSDTVAENEPGSYDSEGLEKIYNKMKLVYNAAMERNESYDKIFNSELINKVFSQFTSLRISNNQVFDIYTYVSKYPKNRRNFVPKDYNSSSYVYVHNKVTTEEFCPRLKCSVIQRMLRKTPDNIEFDIPVYKESMLIKKPIFTRECFDAIPNVIEYINCSLTKESAWEVFLFLTLAYGHVGAILFSLDTFRKRHSDLFTEHVSGTWIDKSDIKKLETTDVYPKVSIDGNVVKISCLQYRSKNIVKINAELNYDKDRFKLNNFRVEKFIVYQDVRICLKDPDLDI